MKKYLATGLIFLLLNSMPTAVSASPKIGSSCLKINQFHQSGSTLLVCSSVKGKKSWRKASSVEKALHLKEKNRLIQAAAQKIIDDAKAEATQIVSQANAAAAAAASASTSYDSLPLDSECKEISVPICNNGRRSPALR